MTSRKPAPIRPGDILNMEFLQPLGFTQYRLAKGINAPPQRINEIVSGTRRMTANTASAWPATSATPNASG